MNTDSHATGLHTGTYCETPLRPHRVLIFLLPVLLLAVTGSEIARAEIDSARVDRLFMWASAGSIRFQNMVGPAKDSLAAMGERAARWLARKTNATDARERRTLADLFEKIGPPGAAPLIPYLDSGGIWTPQNAARCLGLTKDTSAALPLTRKLDHPYFGVRSEVATALGKIRDRRGVLPLLSRFAREEDADVRKSCVVSLGLIADPQAADALIRALSDPFFGVRQTAVISLDQIKPPPVNALMLSARGLSGIGLHGALVALGGCDDPAGRDMLIGILESPSPLIRGFAVEGLSAHTNKHVMKRIGKLKQTEKNPFVLAQIARLEKQRKP